MDSILYDSDGDGIADILEMLLNGNLDSDTIDDTDSDGDGVSDALEELLYGNLDTDMEQDGYLTDSDNDGLADILEYLMYGDLTTFQGIGLFERDIEKLCQFVQILPRVIVEGNDDQIHRVFRLEL